MVIGLIHRVITREGGYVWHEADKGGPTNMGITQKTLSDWRGHEVTPKDVEAMTQHEAVRIYRNNYWSEPGFDQLEITCVCKEMVFDAAVHHGPGRAVRFLQLASGGVVDGVIGPMTRECARIHPGDVLATNLMAVRVEFLGKLITKDPSQAVFAAGWMNRMGELMRLIPQA